jgi:hypothetical protein
MTLRTDGALTLGTGIVDIVLYHIQEILTECDWR